MNRIRIAMGAAGVAAVLAAGTASAQAQITKIAVSATKDGATSQPVLPVNTRSVWVAFEYQRAGTSEITVKVVTAGGTTVFQDEDTYSGSGTASVEVTGAEIYASIMASLADLADVTEGALAKIASQEQIRQYASDATNYIGQMEILESLVSSARYEGLDQPSLASLTSSLLSLGELKEEMSKAAEDEDKRVTAAAMEPHVVTLMAAIDALTGDAVADFPVPPSAAATGEAAYLVQIAVDGFPSKSMDFWIWGDTASEKAPDEEATAPAVGVVGGPASSAGRTPPAGGAALVGGDSSTGAAAPGVVVAGSGLVVPSAGATATALMAAAVAEKAGQPQMAPPAQVAPPGQDASSEVMAGQSLASPTSNSYVVKGVLEPPGGSGGGEAAEATLASESGPNFAMLLVGVVVLAGVAVFMKGRM